MELPLIVSFFTPDWEYESHSRRLIKECQSLRLDYRIERRESRGGYIQNSCIKPGYILECLQEAKRPVLWIDVDGSIFRRPTFFKDEGFDFQARKMDPRYRRRVWHVGTMWFDYNDRVLEFVSAWIKRTGDMTDESALDQTWKARDWGLRTREVPPEYFYIWRDGRHLPKGTVIAHRLSKSESKKEQTRLFTQYERLIG